MLFSVCSPDVLRLSLPLYLPTLHPLIPLTCVSLSIFQPATHSRSLSPYLYKFPSFVPLSALCYCHVPCTSRFPNYKCVSVTVGCWRGRRNKEVLIPMRTRTLGMRQKGFNNENTLISMNWPKNNHNLETAKNKEHDTNKEPTRE